MQKFDKRKRISLFTPGQNLGLARNFQSRNNYDICIYYVIAFNRYNFWRLLRLRYLMTAQHFSFFLVLFSTYHSGQHLKFQNSKIVRSNRGFHGTQKTCSIHANRLVTPGSTLCLFKCDAQKSNHAHFYTRNIWRESVHFVICVTVKNKRPSLLAIARNLAVGIA